MYQLELALYLLFVFILFGVGSAIGNYCYGLMIRRLKKRKEQKRRKEEIKKAVIIIKHKRFERLQKELEGF